MKIKTKPSLIDYFSDHRLEIAGWVCAAAAGCSLLVALSFFIGWLI
jgi:hypothetical protein